MQSIKHFVYKNLNESFKKVHWKYIDRFHQHRKVHNEKVLYINNTFVNCFENDTFFSLPKKVLRPPYRLLTHISSNVSLDCWSRDVVALSLCLHYDLTTSSLCLSWGLRHFKPFFVWLLVIWVERNSVFDYNYKWNSSEFIDKSRSRLYVLRILVVILTTFE